MFVKNQEIKLTLVDNFAKAIQVEKDFETMSSVLGEEEKEILMESYSERVISQLQDEITNLKKDKGERGKPFKKKTSTNTSLKVLPTPRINLEDYALDNFCHTHYAHWLPHFVPDTLLLQEMAYQTYVNGVAASLHRKKKGLWPLFPLITKVCKIGSFKQAKDEVGPQGKLKEHLQRVGFIWIYSHEDLFPGELSQQQVLVKSQIPTSDHMTKVDKEVDIQGAIAEKNRAAIEWKNPIRIEYEEEELSYSSMFVNILDSDQQDSVEPSHQSPSFIEAPFPEHLEEVHSSLITEKISSKRNSVIHEEENPSSYNIE